MASWYKLTAPGRETLYGCNDNPDVAEAALLRLNRPEGDEMAPYYQMTRLPHVAANQLMGQVQLFDEASVAADFAADALGTRGSEKQIWN